MPDNISMQDLRSMFAGWLRVLEQTRVKSDPDRLRNLETMTDAELIRRWLWLITFVGTPIAFGLAFILPSLSFLPWGFVGFLITMDKGAMGLMFIIFMLAIYFTVRQTNE